MSDRSVNAESVTQSVIVTGNGNTVTLSFGATGIALPLFRPQFAPPRRGQPRELDLLRPGARDIPFQGRADLMGEMRAWLDAEQDILVHAITGRAGTGKTRLAVELCRAMDNNPAAKGPWLAGFIAPDDLASVVDRPATWPFVWEHDTLLVLDYAAQIAAPIGRWLDRQANERHCKKLRVLLLERAAPEDFGWWRELTNPPLQGSASRRGLFYDDRPRALPDLVSDGARHKRFRRDDGRQQYDPGDYLRAVLASSRSRAGGRRGRRVAGAPRCPQRAGAGQAGPSRAGCRGGERQTSAR